MSLRGVWVILKNNSLGNGNEEPKVIFSRRWLTVEHRATNISSYCPIPPDNELCASVVKHCADSAPSTHLSCRVSQPHPVFSLFDEQIWPVVCIPKMNSNLLLVSVPLIENFVSASFMCLASPAITTAMNVLDSIASIIGDDCTEISEASSVIDDIYQFLYLSCPFGSPLEIESSNLSCVLQSSKAAKNSPAPRVKKAAWQAGAYRGASKLAVSISEEVKAVLYDKKNISDVCEVNGIVQCKADLEGYPDVLLTVTTPTNSPPLDHILTHSCVQSSDSHLARQDSSDQKNRKLRFSPPVGQLFTLAHYQWSSLAFLPIRGYYQMKGEAVVKLLIQLKLHASIRNNFEYFEVHIPFFNRGSIEKVDSIIPVTASPSLALSQDRKIIIWTIGQKFPVKSLETSLQASVHFFDRDSLQLETDNFCTGSTSYIDLFFKAADFTLSGCDIDTKSITLFPPSKYKLTSSCELYSSHYRIWNSHGDALCTWPQIR